ncbi:MAG: hypothetical protein K2W94_06630 [Alphaproteobacteria bacterium]|nr:hypothetical protein [Alphaproteobacteria bacterium]
MFGDFYQGSRRVGSNTVNSLATVEIDEIDEIDEIIIDDTSLKHIALFKGKYTKKVLSKAKLSGFVTPVVEKHRRRIHVKIHHYPLGVEDQRRNKGGLEPTNKSTAHYVSTLPGSSGAPVLSKDGDFLIGIHTGAGTEKKKVKYTGDIIANLKGKEFTLSESNQYADISKGELGGFGKQFKKRGRK